MQFDQEDPNVQITEAIMALFRKAREEAGPRDSTPATDTYIYNRTYEAVLDFATKTEGFRDCTTADIKEGIRDGIVARVKGAREDATEIADHAHMFLNKAIDGFVERVQESMEQRMRRPWSYQDDPPGSKAKPLLDNRRTVNRFKVRKDAILAVDGWPMRIRNLKDNQLVLAYLAHPDPERMKAPGISWQPGDEVLVENHRFVPVPGALVDRQGNPSSIVLREQAGSTTRLGEWKVMRGNGRTLVLRSLPGTRVRLWK